MKVLQKDKHGQRYILEWKNGYVMGVNHWSQFINPRSFNWINFTFWRFDFQWEVLLGRMIEFNFVVLGLGIYIHHIFSTSDYWDENIAKLATKIRISEGELIVVKRKAKILGAAVTHFLGSKNGNVSSIARQALSDARKVKEKVHVLDISEDAK